MTDRAFDEKMRSLLEQAEVPVPEGAWEAVRTRIPAVKPVKKTAPWWWACAGLAAAAAIAMALVLSGTFRSAQVAPALENTLAQNVVEVTPPAETAPAAAEPVTEIPTRHSAPAIRVGKRAPQPVVTPKTVEDETTSSASTATATVTNDTPAETAPAAMQGIESASTKSGSRRNEPAASGKETVESWSDPFARMAYEDMHAKTRRPMSFDLKGLVGTNDKAKSTGRSTMMASSGRSAAATAAETAYITEEGESRYDVPLSLGVGVKFYLSERWAIGTGIDYSLLMRSFPGSYTKGSTVIKPVNSNIKHTVQYIGIPVNLYYDVISTPRMKLYGFAGGSLEKGIGQKFTIPASEGTEYYKQRVPGLQGSAGLGLGVQFNITDVIGVYVDPSARYYFGNNQPKTIRTQQNVIFNLELGVRFDL